MSYGSIRKQMQEQSAPEVDKRRCFAAGCPCLGSVSIEASDRFCCTAHAFSVSERWPAITERLNEFRWLIEFIDEMKKMQTLAHNWRAFAEQFWDGQDDFCKPDPKEGAIPYENRMRGELLYRCGIAKRPSVRLPQPVTVRGNAGRYMGAQ